MTSDPSGDWVAFADHEFALDEANERADDLRRRLADKEKAFSGVVIEADMIANDRRDELRRANEREERAESMLRQEGALRAAADAEVERLRGQLKTCKDAAIVLRDTLAEEDDDADENERRIARAVEELEPITPGETTDEVEILIGNALAILRGESEGE